MVRNFESKDKGKNVMTADGDMVGTVDSVSGSTAHIRADEKLSQSTRRRLGGSEDDEDTFELQHSKVDSITDDEIRLARDL